MLLLRQLKIYLAGNRRTHRVPRPNVGRRVAGKEFEPSAAGVVMDGNARAAIDGFEPDVHSGCVRAIRSGIPVEHQSVSGLEELDKAQIHFCSVARAFNEAARSLDA